MNSPMDYAEKIDSQTLNVGMVDEGSDWAMEVTNCLLIMGDNA